MIKKLTVEEMSEIYGSDYLEDLNDFQTGKIDFSEYERREHERQRQRFTPKLLAHQQRGEWKEFINIALTVYEVMPIAFMFYEEVPDELKYDFAIQAYIHHGDSIPAVRKAVRSALRYGKPNLPHELAEMDEITVYRAGEEPIEKSPYRISWTTDKSVALFFLNDYIGRHASHLYKAKIKPEKIIAYTDDRNEKEIMQYRNVYDIEEL